MTGATNPLMINLWAREQIVDGTYSIPDAVLRQALAHQQQKLAGHRVLVYGITQSQLTAASLRIPVLPALALPDGVVCEHDKAILHKTQIGCLVGWNHPANPIVPARRDDARERSAGPG